MILTRIHTQIILAFSLLFSTLTVNAQFNIPVEVMGGNEQMTHQLYLIKNFDAEGKVNLFTMARFSADYEDALLNSSLISTQVTYNLTRAIGLSVGITSANNEFNPLAAVSLSYMNPKGDLFFNLFPSVILNDNTDLELSGIFLYTPRINDTYSFFSQAIFASSFNNQLSEHLFSNQQIRIGLGYKDLFQAGVGLDRTVIGDNLFELNNIGVFIRKEF